MDLPLGYKSKSSGLVCKLNKSIYGLRQASRQWFYKFTSALLTHKFKQSKHDYSLFSYGSGDKIIYLLVYVDNIILVIPSKDMMHKVHKLLEASFKLKILGDLKYLLGLELANSKSVSLPMDANLKLSNSDGDLLADSSIYRRLIGSQFLSKPITTHMNTFHHLLRYLKGTVEKRLMAYADADWSGCPDIRRSVLDYCVFIGDSLISWRSKKQLTVFRSSVESEYRAMAAVAAELTWLTGLLSDFQIKAPSSMLFCDSMSAIYIASNPTFHERTKHIEHQLVDVFMKPITLTQFHNLISKFGMIDIYLPT
ncbi:hypothetical protein AAHE18_10G168300 [Arachis hypogaea]